MSKKRSEIQPYQPVPVVHTIMATNRRGEVAAIYTSEGPFLSADFHFAMIDIIERITAAQVGISALLSVAEGKRRSDSKILRQLQGEMAACGTGVLSLVLEHGVSAEDPLVTDVKRHFARYGGALQKAIEGDLSDLERLAASVDTSFASTVLREVAGIRTRGHAPTQARTKILGRIIHEVHQQGQAWVVTARKVAEKLRNLDARLYPWAAYDAAQLADYVSQGDGRRCREFLRNAYETHKKRTAVRRNSP